MALYKEMTASERCDAYVKQREAVNVHQDAFAIRPYNPRSHADRRAWAHMEKCQREAAFIERVARSCGDRWAV